MLRNQSEHSPLAYRDEELETDRVLLFDERPEPQDLMARLTRELDQKIAKGFAERKKQELKTGAA